MTLLESVKNLLKNLILPLNYANDRASLPEGTLLTRKEKGKVRYYSYNTKTKGSKYINDNKSESIKALEEKLYKKKLEGTLKTEIKNLKKVEKILEKTPQWETVFYNIPEAKRHLIKPFELKPIKLNEQDVLNWKLRNRARRNIKTPNKTMNGEYVKSKSELIIADRLHAAGVPYVYEVNLGLAEEHTGMFVTWNPDFKVLNVRTGKEYYWEHLGKLDDPEYLAVCMFKIETYWKNNIVQGDNLIITIETSTSALNTEYVDMLIQKLLK